MTVLATAPTHLTRALAAVRRRPAELPPVALGYLAVAWAIFLVVIAIDYGNRRELVDPLGYSIGDLRTDLPRVLAVLPVATFVNVGVSQILYVTAMLALFGPIAARQSGQWTAAAVFLGTSIAAALVAGIALYAIDTQVGGRVIDDAWERSWNGGSAGCYGLFGFIAAGSRRPWHLLAFGFAWELGLAAVHLRSYTPAFHISALLAGFVAGSLLVRRPATRAVPAR